MFSRVSKGLSNKYTPNFSCIEAGRDWKGLNGMPKLPDPPSEDENGTYFSASVEVPALCVPARNESLTTSNIGESGAARSEDSSLLWHQLRKSWT